MRRREFLKGLLGGTAALVAGMAACPVQLGEGEGGRRKRDVIAAGAGGLFRFAAKAANTTLTLRGRDQFGEEWAHEVVVDGDLQIAVPGFPDVVECRATNGGEGRVHSFMTTGPSHSVAARPTISGLTGRPVTQWASGWATKEEA